MPDIYKADELAETGSVRSLAGLHKPDRSQTASNKGVAKDEEGVPEATRSPGPSDETLERVQRVLSEAAAQFQGRRNSLLNTLKPQLVELVMAISEAVIQRELQADSEAIMRTIDRALAELGEAQRIVLRVHPDDARLLREAVAEGAWPPCNVTDFDITPDTSIRPGGCVLESERGQVDATIGVQLSEIGKHLQDTTVGSQPADG